MLITIREVKLRGLGWGFSSPHFIAPQLVKLDQHGRASGVFVRSEGKTIGIQIKGNLRELSQFVGSVSAMRLPIKSAAWRHPLLKNNCVFVSTPGSTNQWCSNLGPLGKDSLPVVCLRLLPGQHWRQNWFLHCGL